MCRRGPSIHPLPAIQGWRPQDRFEILQSARHEADRFNVVLGSVRRCFPSLLKAGGRLAFVVPAEIGYVPYARPVIRFLLDNFSNVQVIAVKEKGFSDLSEAVWFVYASGYGKSSNAIDFSLHDSFRDVPDPPSSGEYIIRTDLKSWNDRLRPYLLPQTIRTLYLQIGHLTSVVRLGDWARVSVGYVTGANDFFHLRPSEVQRLEIPNEFLMPSLRRSAFLPQKAATHNTAKSWPNRDQPVLLLNVPAGTPIPTEVRHYLNSSAGQKAKDAYKMPYAFALVQPCRTFVCPMHFLGI